MQPMFRVFQQRHPKAEINGGKLTGDYVANLKEVFTIQAKDADAAIKAARYRHPFFRAEGMGFFPIVEEIQA